MQVTEVDVRNGDGYAVMADLRSAYHEDMSIRYPGADYGPKTLPKGLHPPTGAFFVLYDNKSAVGCAGLRALQVPNNEERCVEGKSLFVKRDVRRRGGAVLLMQSLIDRATELGDQWLYGNTGASQPESLRLLRDSRWGFEEIELYDTTNPLAAFAFRLDLRTVQTA